jgi:hypothetical protein
MNVKRYFLAAISLFIFIFAYETFVHGKLMLNIYSETPNIWRSPEQMAAYVPFNILIMATLSLWITFIFTQLFKKGGWKNGLEFGLYFGVLSGIQAVGSYYFLPISATLATCWFIAYVIESLIGGILVGAIYS